MFKTIAMKIYCLILSVFVILGCTKEKSKVVGEVELYLIESYSTVDYHEIDESSVTTQIYPIVKYADFVSYDSNLHEFKITSDAAETIKNLEHSVHGLPFAIKANNELIYTGYFWPSYSSVLCTWVTIDPLMVEYSQSLVVNIGYPGSYVSYFTPDKRNDARIINIFKRDGKLK